MDVLLKDIFKNMHKFNLNKYEPDKKTFKTDFKRCEQLTV